MYVKVGYITHAYKHVGYKHITTHHAGMYSLKINYLSLTIVLSLRMVTIYIQYYIICNYYITLYAYVTGHTKIDHVSANYKLYFR